MAINTTAAAMPAESLLTEVAQRLRDLGNGIRRNPKLLLGLVLVFGLIGFGLIGPHFVDVKEARPMSVFPDQRPSRAYPFGTESQGRSLLALVVKGIPLTVEVGLVAGAIGLGIGTVLGFIAGYMGGVVDTVIRSVADIMLTVPGLLVLIVVASSIKGIVSVQTIAYVVASLAWMFPTRTVRAQVLTMREHPYVEMAKLNGMKTPQIIIKELFPNLLPYLGASFVGAVGSAILAEIGLEALGLGPQSEPTLGMTIYWAIFYSALLRGEWWWWAAPVGVIVILFTGLFLIAAGLDEVANPRLRRAV